MAFLERAADFPRCAKIEGECGSAARRWDALVLGRSIPQNNADEIEDGQESSRQVGSLTPGFVQDAGAEDPAYHAGPRGPPLQRTLSSRHLINDDGRATRG